MSCSPIKASSPRPLLTICCITYNHASFIHEAISGFLNQETSFPIELLIHDDASTDGTTDIIKCYQEKNPALIKTILQSENQYSTRGFSFFADVLNQAQGKYIALCEGDDYWADPLKLQKQVDFLEANPDFSICFHRVQILEGGVLKDDYITKPPGSVSTIEDLARENYIHTCSCVFRNRGAEILGPSFGKSPLGDYYLHMMNAQFGGIYMIDAVMAVYRVHDNSLWSSLGKFQNLAKTLIARKCILEDLGGNQASVRASVIQSSINGILRARKEFRCEILSLRDVTSDGEEYLGGLFDRLIATLEEVERINRMNHSNRSLLKRILANCKGGLRKCLAANPFG